MLDAWLVPAYTKYVDSFLSTALGHAQVLQGPAALGKNALIQHVAKRLLCHQAEKAVSACRVCVSCQRFEQGTHGDYKILALELNEKTGKMRKEVIIDQIRALNEWLSLTAQLSGAKVVVFSCADALNKNAANALLKMLEEPMPNRFLFLISDKPQMLPATIRSRCQRTEIAMPSFEQGMAWLEQQHIDANQAKKMLDLAQGNPGLAKRWIEVGGSALYDTVRAELISCAKNTQSLSVLSQAWLADAHTDLRLLFAAQMGHAMAKKWVPDANTPGKPALLILKLHTWIDEVNRLRLSLVQPMRHELGLTGLLMTWRQLMQESRLG